MTAKTNAARLLDRLGIHYELRAYPSDPDDLSPERLERALQLPREQIWKTLVVRGESTGPLFAVIPIAARLNLKVLAQRANSKRVELLPLAQVFAHTGYVRGAVTALAAKRPFPVFIDERCHDLERLGVSAGALGLELLLTPADYLRASAARTVPIAEAPESIG